MFMSGQKQKYNTGHRGKVHRLFDKKISIHQNWIRTWSSVYIGQLYKINTKRNFSQWLFWLMKALISLLFFSIPGSRGIIVITISVVLLTWPVWTGETFCTLTPCKQHWYLWTQKLAHHFLTPDEIVFVKPNEHKLNLLS